MGATLELALVVVTLEETVALEEVAAGAQSPRTAKAPEFVVDRAAASASPAPTGVVNKQNGERRTSPIERRGKDL